MTAFSPDPADLGPGAPRDPVIRGLRHVARAEIALARRARFSRWDGSQQVADLDADEILDAMSDDVMAEGDLAEALRRLMERGWRTGDPTRGDLAGLRDLMDRLERRREAMLERYGLGDVLGDIRRELDEIVAQERAGVERGSSRRGRRRTRTPPRRRPASDPAAPGPAADPGLRRMLRDVAAKRLDQLDALPDDIGERIRGLREYDFLEPEARQRFDELVQRLQQQMLDQYVSGMSDAIRSMTPGGPRREPRDGPRPQRPHPAADRRRATRTSRSSWRSTARSSRAPGRFDDIIEQLAARMAAMQSLLRSMRPEQRAELQSMMEALLQDDRLLVDLAELASNLDLLLPGGLGERLPFSGDEPLGLAGALARSTSSRRWTAWRTRSPTSTARTTSPASTATRSATCSATTRCATSTRSTTWRGGSRRPAT